jgi:hypothetical protein
MGRDPGEQATPDLFSTEMVRDASPSPIKPIPATQIAVDASSQRDVLPKNLRKAIRHLSDGELDLLHAEHPRGDGAARQITADRSDDEAFVPNGQTSASGTDDVDAWAGQCRSCGI